MARKAAAAAMPAANKSDRKNAPVIISFCHLIILQSSVLVTNPKTAITYSTMLPEVRHVFRSSYLRPQPHR